MWAMAVLPIDLVLLARLLMDRVAEAQDGIWRSEEGRGSLVPESDWVGWTCFSLKARDIVQVHEEKA